MPDDIVRLGVYKHLAFGEILRTPPPAKWAEGWNIDGHFMQDMKSGKVRKSLSEAELSDILRHASLKSAPKMKPLLRGDIVGG